MRQKMGSWSLIISAAGWIIGIISLEAYGDDIDNLIVEGVNGFTIGGFAIPFIYGLASIVLGILSIVEKQRHRADAIIGSLLALPLIIWGEFLLLYILGGMA